MRCNVVGDDAGPAVRLVMLAGVMVLVAACAPATEPLSPPAFNYDEYFELAVDGERAPYREGAWVHAGEGFELRVSIGEPTQVQGVWLGPNRVRFSLSNTGSDAIRIVWDESSVITPDGSAGRAARPGVSYGNVAASAPPTVVPPSSRIDDFVVNADNVTYSRETGWTELPLIEHGAAAGTSFRVFLTLERAGTRESLDLAFTRNARPYPWWMG
jgi:hypothetical protein